MKTYYYTLPFAIQSTEKVGVFNELQQEVATVQRIYSSSLKKILDKFFDYRYFLKYEVMVQNQPTFTIKKVIKRGKLWYEAVDLTTNDRYIINYYNWRIGIPELYISKKKDSFKMKIDKEMEQWSKFYYNEKEVARWAAVFNEEQQNFQVAIEIEEDAPIQAVDFYIGIGQATLFVGA